MCLEDSNSVNIYTRLDAYFWPKIKTLINKLTRYQVFSTLDLKCTHYQVLLYKDDKPFSVFEVNRSLYQFTWMLFVVTNKVATFQWTIDKFEKNFNTIPYLDNITIARRNQVEYDKYVKMFLESPWHWQLMMNKSKSTLSAKKISVFLGNW